MKNRASSGISWSSRSGRRNIFTRRKNSGSLPSGRRFLWIAVGVAVLAVLAALIVGNILKSRAERIGATLTPREDGSDVSQPTPYKPVLSRYSGTVDTEFFLDNGNNAVPRDAGVLIPVTTDSVGAYSVSLDCLPMLGKLPQAGAKKLLDLVSSYHKSGHSAVVVYTPACFSDETADAATVAYLRGIDLCVLSECVAAGVDGLLLTDVSCRTQAQTSEYESFLTDLREQMGRAGASKSAWVGVTVPLDTVLSDSRLAELSPDYTVMAKLLTVADTVVLDLREQDAVSVTETAFDSLYYVYRGFPLWLLVDGSTDKAAVSSRGFERMMIYR